MTIPCDHATTTQWEIDDIETADLYAALGDVAALLEVGRSIVQLAQSPRDILAHVLWSRGETLREIGEVARVSVQRVHQIVESREGVAIEREGERE